jgi:tetratricopeptide (TPR) repeat protein
MTQASAMLQKAIERHRQGQSNEALSWAQRAVLVAPADPMAFNIRGMILQSLQRDSEARWDFDLAIALKPDFADALNNRGTVYARLGQFALALQCYERSLALDPNQPHALYNRSTTRLALGDWIRGFQDFESRWALFPHEGQRRKNLGPMWNGEPVAGKTILLHHEQGFGDALQFCRFALPVLHFGARVLMAVPRPLTRLLGTLPCEVQIIADGDPIPPHDFSCPLMSLPRVFGTTPETVPDTSPYLHADPALVRGWNKRLGRRSRPRIGLVWSGRRYPPINHPRDISLRTILPLLDLDAQFVSLQQKLTPAEQAILTTRQNVLVVGDELKDFADSAALVNNLDLVITVDTAVAHLAGALGRPVWVLNRFATCWRWLLNRSDSPWYPSLRLFRQPTLGDWDSVVQNVRAAADQFLNDATAITVPGSAPSIERQHVHEVAYEEMSAVLIAALNKALAHYHAGRLAEAIAKYREILQQRPQQAQALHFLGVALAQTGAGIEGAAVLERAVAVSPRDPLIHVHYANTLKSLGRAQDALQSFGQAIKLDPRSAEAHYNKAVCLAAMDRKTEAEESYNLAIACNPDHASAYNNLGNLYCDRNSVEEAQHAYERAIQISPTFTDAWINLSIAQRRLHKYSEALHSADEALRLSPASAVAHSAHGATLACMGQSAESLQSYARALALQPDLAEGLWNKALAHLLRGEFHSGWPLYEARWNVRSLRLRPYQTERPIWNGESLDGQTVLLHAEQGYGDSIQFCRYAALVAQRGARVILGVPSALHGLMRSLPAVAEVVSQGDPPPFDCHCPLLSLPRIFETDLSNIPPAPYLNAQDDARARWASRLEPASTYRIGLAWSGSPTHTNDANRSIPLAQLLPLLSTKAQFISLQKAVRLLDLPALESGPGLHRWGEEFVDFADAAALVAELDLVITVDTAIAHLAGALGKATWIILPQVPDWRWMEERSDSPWYPTARLFRQPPGGTWISVVEDVRRALSEILDSRRALS